MNTKFEHVKKYCIKLFVYVCNTGFYLVCHELCVTQIRHQKKIIRCSLITNKPVLLHHFLMAADSKIRLTLCYTEALCFRGLFDQNTFLLD